jgi:lipoate-protein ligase A
LWIDDDILKNYKHKHALNVFVPSSPMVVLGSSNDASLEVDLESCKALGVPVTRRYGGGGTVVLYDGCVVVSFGTWVKEPYQNNFYFKLVNQAMIDSLKDRWSSFAGLSQNGISDIVFGQQKVAGTSLFRSRHYLLYQASLLVRLDKALIGSVLNHPTKEPEYRKGRSHESFLTCLSYIEPLLQSCEEVVTQLKESFLKTYEKAAAGHMIEPVETEMRSLEERLERSEHLPSI